MSTAAQESQAEATVHMLLAQAEAKRVNFEKLLPSTISWNTFKDTFKIAVQTRPSLLLANRESLWVALQKAAMDGLMPDGREGALVIFNEEVDDDGQPIAATKGKKEKMVQWMPMIRGLIKMARNTGDVTTLRAVLIYRGETFTMRDEDGQQFYKHERIVSDEFDDSDRAIVGTFAVINFKDGSWDVEVMSRSQVERVRAVSSAKSPKAPWQQWYGQMTQKTVLRRLLKRQASASVAHIEASLDRDDSMTIEGEPVQQQAQLPAPTPAVDIGLNKPAKEPVKVDPNEDPRDASLGTKVATASGPVHTDPPAGKPAQNAAGGASAAAATTTPAEPPKPAVQQPAQVAPAFDAGAADEFGEPVTDVGMDGLFDDPVAWAAWFAATARTASNIEALFEHNSDAAGDAAKASEQAGAMIMDALNDARDRAKETAAPAEEAPQPTPVPKDTTGKPAWTQYWSTLKTQVHALKTVEEVDAWEALHEPVYRASPTISKTAASALMKRREEVRPRRDTDREWAERSGEEVRKMLAWAEIEEWVKNTANRVLMRRLETERPELFAAVDDVIAKRKEEFGA